jgi:hypothetical protein
MAKVQVAPGVEMEKSADGSQIIWVEPGGNRIIPELIAALNNSSRDLAEAKAALTRTADALELVLSLDPEMPTASEDLTTAERVLLETRALLPRLPPVDSPKEQ